MKKYNVFLMALQEIRHGYKQMLLNLFILTLIYSVALCILSTARNVPEQLIDSIRNEYTEGIRISFRNVNISEIDIIEEVGLKDIELRLNVENRILSNAMLAANNFETIEHDGRALFFTDENSFHSERITNEIVYGNIWLESDNRRVDGTYGIWINTQLAAELGIILGDSITFSNDYSDYVMLFHVKGIFDTVDDEISYVIPLYAAAEIAAASGLSEKCFGAGVLYDVASYLSVTDTLNAAGISTSGIGIVYDLFRGAQMVTFTFYAFAVILIIAGVGILFTLNQMYLKNRESFIGILRTLGCTVGNISIMFFIISEIILIISIVMSSFVSKHFNHYIAAVVSELYNFSDVSIYNTWDVPIIAYIISNIVLLVVFGSLAAKISSIDPLRIILASKE